MDIRGIAGWAMSALVLSAVNLAPPARALAEPEALRFEMPKTVVRVGQSRVIPFKLSAPAAQRRNIETSIQGDAARVIRTAEVLAGFDTGFLRVTGDHAGTCTLNVQGTELTLEVIDESAPIPHAELSPLPRIVTPNPGAIVWGQITVGVEWFVSSTDPSSPTREVKLILPDGKALTPTSMTNFGSSPHWTASFIVPASALPAGEGTLRPVITGARGETLNGAPIALRAIEPSADQLTIIEAEEWATASRPSGFNRGNLSIGKDEACSGGKFVNCGSADPTLTYTVEIDRPGRYQAIATVAADVGAAGFPVVGLVLDGAQYAITSGRLSQTAWHRVALGTPVNIQPGFRAFSFRFDNDSYFPPKNDRNLRIDRIELVRLDGPAGPNLLAGAAGDSMMAPAMSAPGTDAMMAPPTASAPDTRMDAAANAGSINAADMMLALGASSMSEGTDPDLSITRPVRVAFDRVLHRRTVVGELEVTGICAWDNQDKAPAPVTMLVLNGRTHSTQRALMPRFWIDQSSLQAGENTIQLIARADSGALASTCTQTIINPDTTTAPGPVGFKRYTVRDGAWDASVRDQVKPLNDIDEKRRVLLANGTSAALRLDEDLTGTFRVFAECRSGAGKAGGKLRVVSTDAATVTSTFTTVQNWWDTIPLGTIELRTGPKKLALECEQAKGSPGAQFTGLILQRVTDAPRATTAVIAYPTELPSARTEMWLQDAVVVNTRSTHAIRSAEVLIDSKPTFVTLDVQRQAGPYTLPLLLRSVAPGAHELRVKLTDIDGQEILTAPRTITVSAQEPSEPTRYHRALTLLDRFAFGPDPAELGAILTQGEEPWLRDRLSRPSDDPADRAAFELACLRFSNSRSPEDIQRRAVQLAISSANPTRARFLLWASNHFTTWIRKVEADIKWPEFAAFQRLGVARFDDLLFASATSPAMLRYLDQERSIAGKLNENYAREIMELHTLGVHGGYTQADVTSLAKLLNGWTTYSGAEGRGSGGVRDLEFRYDPSLNDGAERSIFGMSFAQADPADRFDRIRSAIEMLASHPSTAKFVARSLADHYVNVDAPQALIDDLAREFMTSGGDMRQVLLALSRHPLFWSSPLRVAQPVDYAVRLQRVGTVPMANPANDYLRRSRQALFDCPTPNGYSDKDEDYVDSNAMLQRLRLSRDSMYALAGLVPNAIRYAADDAKWLPADWSQRVVDILAVRIIGRVLGEESNTAALKIITESTGNRDARTREAAAFIAQCPEASVR